MEKDRIKVTLDHESGKSLEPVCMEGVEPLCVGLHECSLNHIRTAEVKIDSNIVVLATNYEGALLARDAVHARWSAITPNSLAATVGPRDLILRIARGNHRLRLICWDLTHTPLLANWLRATRFNPDQPSSDPIAIQLAVPNFVAALERVETALIGPKQRLPLLIMSGIVEILSHLFTMESSPGLTPIPGAVAEPIARLIEAVKQERAASWPLKDAAEIAGYSPFHFSRVFKATVGFGFHEFVDRCRTELAVEKLLTTDAPIDYIATACGFGTTQGLRESTKEYLGLVPSELRAETEC